MTSLLWHFLDFLSNHMEVSSISVITIFLIRTMSVLVDISRMETGTVEEGFFSDVRFPFRSTKRTSSSSRKDLINENVSEKHYHASK